MVEPLARKVHATKSNPVSPRSGLNAKSRRSQAAPRRHASAPPPLLRAPSPATSCKKLFVIERGPENTQRFMNLILDSEHCAVKQTGESEGAETIARMEHVSRSPAVDIFDQRMSD